MWSEGHDSPRHTQFTCVGLGSLSLLPGLKDRTQSRQNTQVSSLPTHTLSVVLTLLLKNFSNSVMLISLEDLSTEPAQWPSEIIHTLCISSLDREASQCPGTFQGVVVHAPVSGGPTMKD